MIMEYVRNGQKKKIGVLVADLTSDGNIAVGHSKWNKKLDEYNIQRGKEVAIERVLTDSKTPPAITIYKAYLKFVDRAIKYFKGAQISRNTIMARHAAMEKQESLKN